MFRTREGDRGIVTMEEVVGRPVAGLVAALEVDVVNLSFAEEDCTLVVVPLASIWPIEYHT